MSNWGKAHENNTIGFGQGSANNSIGWGSVYDKSFSGDTILNPVLINPFKDAVSYYKLNETTGAVIDSNSGFNGTPVNGVVQGVQGIKGNAFEFDGIDDYVALPNNYDFVQNTNVFTINMWVKMFTLNKIQAFFGGFVDIETLGFVINIRDDNKLRFLSIGDSGANVFETNQNAINDNDFHMITFVGVGSSCNIYVDGVLKFLSRNDFAGLGSGNSTIPYSLGASLRTKTFSNAVIDEVSVFDTSKTQEEITEIYNFYTQ